jgi:hypothetical protein
MGRVKLQERRPLNASILPGSFQSFGDTLEGNHARIVLSDTLVTEDPCPSLARWLVTKSVKGGSNGLVRSGGKSCWMLKSVDGSTDRLQCVEHRLVAESSAAALRHRIQRIRE